MHEEVAEHAESTMQSGAAADDVDVVASAETKKKVEEQA